MNMNTSRRSINGDSANARGIMYHSRMRYLKARDGPGRKTTLGNRASEIIGENSSLGICTSQHFPCSSENLVPPSELMTRQRSFKQLYWKYHPPNTQIRKMEFLRKKEDPIAKKKREAIFERIRAAEMAAERSKREKEAWKRAEQRLSGVTDSVSLLSSSIVEQTSERDDTADGGKNYEGLNGGFVFERKKNNITHEVSTNSGNDDASLNDLDSYPDDFAFLSDWRKERNWARKKNS